MIDPAILLKRSIEMIFSPLGVMTVLLAAGVVLEIARPQHRAGRRLLLCGALVFLVVFFSPVSEYLTYRLERQFEPLLAPPESPRTGSIVVLAGYAEDNPGSPITSNISAPTAGCLSEGLRLHRLIPKAKLIMSGGPARKRQKPVAAMMADYLRQMGVPVADLVVEGNSLNTYENLFQVRKLVGTDPFILVAAACDLRRAVAVAKKLHMNPIPAPACIWTLQDTPRTAGTIEQFAYFFKKFGSPSWNRFFRLQWAYHEYAGYIWYILLGRI